MSPAAIVGMAAGVVLIVTVAGVVWVKKTFPGGAIALALVGFVLIGFSQWSSIKLTAAGASVEVVTKLQADVQRTAEAAGTVAAQAEQAAAAVEANSREVATLVRALDGQRVLNAAATRPILTGLAAVPRLDMQRLATARATLDSVGRR
jgi:hypothetical protein